MTHPYYADDSVTLHHGDCLDVLAAMPDNSVDSVVCDPPYGLANTTPEQVADTLIRWVNGERDYLPSGKGFMGKEWDGFVPPVAVWDDCLRVLKPGGHLLAFAGSRTQDLMGLAIRLAGFEVRDSIAWLYGSGFPKSLDVSKAIDKAAGATRDVVGEHRRHGGGSADSGSMAGPLGTASILPLTAPATPAARQWQGWGTALKPAFEPIVVARKPLQGTVAANVTTWGTGALNIDATRVATPDGRPAWDYPNGAGGHAFKFSENAPNKHGAKTGPAGRWPANVVLDDSQAAALDAENPSSKDGTAVNRNRPVDGSVYDATSYMIGDRRREDVTYGGEGGPSRFFPTFRYQAKAPTRERPSYVKDGAGDSSPLSPKNIRQCNACGSKSKPSTPLGNQPWPTCGHDDWQWVPQARSGEGKVAHPTVKPLALMSWLVRLVTPPGGICLDPFAGSGTTVEAAILEGFRCVAIEREADYLPLILARIERNQPAADAAPAAGVDVPLFDEPAKGRWPTNVVLGSSQAEVLDEQSGELKSGDVAGSKRNTVGGNGNTHGAMRGVVGSSYADKGGASRFFPVFDDALTLFDDDEDGDAA